MENQDEKMVVATVSPRSIGGLSLFESVDPITSENVKQFHSDNVDITEAVRELRKLGFEVLNEGPVTISIRGSRKLFEEVFSTKLRLQKTTVRPGVEVEYLTVDELLTAPGELSNLIEGVAVAIPPEYDESALPPIAPIDPAAYRYLFVPDEVGLVLNADRIHRVGATGKGVKVIMIDSGFYRHPFYNLHGYSVQATILGPGATDPDKDDVGHGTGEAANIFATAPNINLTMIKMADDSTGAFNTAVAKGPKVITCSWGYKIDKMTWIEMKKNYPGDYNYLKTLEAAVANAVASGIVVCFSAGNGGYGFPGSHPDVISVGGVHVNYPSLSLEASNYASSFDSKLYPGRHVPDLCGLVGKSTNIGGNIRAPLILLPVQPGCDLDGISPTTGAVDDGWGLFSGTSAASPQVAGIAALLLEKKPAFTPAQVKEKLIKSSQDVKVGSSAMGDVAGPGWDKATGAGLVNAKWAWLITSADLIADYLEAKPELQAEMLSAGQVPRFPREYLVELFETLRTR